MQSTTKLISLSAILALTLAGCATGNKNQPPPPAPAPAPEPMAAPQVVPEPEPEPVPPRFVLQDVNFETNKADLTLEAQQILNEAAETINYYDVPYQISGHTDSRGSDAYNQKLSEARAQSVYDYLVSQGVSASRLTSQGLGETMPVATNKTTQGMALNRRVEIDPIQ